MTLSLWIALVLVWSAVGGLWVQGARKVPGLRGAEVAPETTAAARAAVRRSSAIAAVLSAGIVAAAVFLPETAARAVAQAAGFGGFHLAFWWGGAPLLRRGRVAAAPAPAPGARTVRVASLVPRDEADLLPARAWALPAAFLGVPVLAGASASVAGAAFTGTTWTIVAGATAFGCVFTLPWGVWAAATARHPQDLAGARDPEALDRACLAFRRTLARGVFALASAAALVAGAVAATALLFDGDGARQGAACGIAGGVGGSLVGLGGGVLGALADRRRRAILDLGGVPPEPGVRSPRAVPAAE